MSLDVKKIALFLNSATFVAQDQRTSKVLKVDDEVLILQSFEGGDLVDESYVTDDVGDNTSAVYMKREEQDMIVYVTQSNKLACVMNMSPDDEDSEWDPTNHDSLGDVRICDGSRISGVSTGEGILVFYQHPDGDIRSIFFDNETRMWEETDMLPANPMPDRGSPLCVTQLEDRLGVFYVAADGKIGGQLQNLETGEWNSYHVANSSFEKRLDNLIIMPNGREGTLDAYVRVGASILHINGIGKRTELGKWEDDGFIPSVSAESGLIINFFWGRSAVGLRVHRRKRHRCYQTYTRRRYGHRFKMDD